jgi:hypothetical protein
MLSELSKCSQSSQSALKVLLGLSKCPQSTQSALKVLSELSKWSLSSQSALEVLSKCSQSALKVITELSKCSQSGHRALKVVSKWSHSSERHFDRNTFGVSQAPPLGEHNGEALLNQHFWSLPDSPFGKSPGHYFQGPPLGGLGGACGSTHAICENTTVRHF